MGKGMTASTKKKCNECIVFKRKAACLFGCNRAERVMRELDIILRDSAPDGNAIEEQLRQCPEAFQAGEMIGKLFDSHKYGRDDAGKDNRYLPPAGAVVPPLV